MGVVEDFLQQRTFLCAKQRARLTARECVRRQGSVAEKIRGSRGTLGTYFDVYCRSGDCDQGKLVKLRLSRREPPEDPTS